MLITCTSTLLRLLVLFFLLLHLLLLALLLRASPRLCMDRKGLHRLRLRYSERTNVFVSAATADDPMNEPPNECYPVHINSFYTTSRRGMLHWDPWRNGSASDSRSEGCVFDSRRVHKCPETQIPDTHSFCPLIDKKKSH